jgi:hypothetical protein
LSRETPLPCAARKAPQSISTWGRKGGEAPNGRRSTLHEDQQSGASRVARMARRGYLPAGKRRPREKAGRMPRPAPSPKQGEEAARLRQWPNGNAHTGAAPRPCPGGAGGSTREGTCPPLGSAAPRLPGIAEALPLCERSHLATVVDVPLPRPAYERCWDAACGRTSPEGGAIRPASSSAIRAPLHGP